MAACRTSGASAPHLFVGGDLSDSPLVPSQSVNEWLGCATPATTSCVGDGSLGACPCNNGGGRGHGCANSFLALGAQLYATGQTSPDTLQLSVGGIQGLVVFLQGDLAPAPVFSGDGLLCLSGNVQRLYFTFAGSEPGGWVAFAPGLDPTSISSRSATLGVPLTAGTTKRYQVQYREPDPLFCPSGASWNFTNGVDVTW